MCERVGKTHTVKHQRDGLCECQSCHKPVDLKHAVPAEPDHTQYAVLHALDALQTTQSHSNSHTAIQSNSNTVTQQHSQTATQSHSNTVTVTQFYIYYTCITYSALVLVLHGSTCMSLCVCVCVCVCTVVS